jgi:hypothetical protein
MKHEVVAVAHQLLHANLLAYCIRYPKEVYNPEEQLIVPSDWQMTDGRISYVEAIKLAQCYIYQVSDGDDKDYRIKNAINMAHTAMNKAITCIPGYEVAPWG